MKAYFAKDEFGEYRLSVNRQRPVFLIGAPGIGAKPPSWSKSHKSSKWASSPTP